MSAFRYADQERKNIRAAEARAKQQAALDMSIAARKAADSYQPLSDDLTDIADLSPANNDFLQRKAGAWVNRTPSQAKADLSLTKADVNLGNVDNTSDASKPISTLTQTALDGKLATWVTAPATTSSTGTAGQIAYDSGYIYICTASNTWKRAALATW